MSNSSKSYITKRNNGIYYVGYFEDGRKYWNSTIVHLESDAVKALRNFENLLRAKPTHCTLEQFSTKFLSYPESIFAYRTYLIYKGALANCKRLWGNPSLVSLSPPEHLDPFKTVRLTDNISPVTVNIELRTLKAAMNTAVGWKMLAVNPFAQIQPLRVPDAVPTYFSKADFQKLLDTILEEWLRAFCGYVRPVRQFTWRTLLSDDMVSCSAKRSEILKSAISDLVVWQRLTPPCLKCQNHSSCSWFRGLLSNCWRLTPKSLKLVIETHPVFL